VGNLDFVRLPASLSVSVLLLPDLALVIEAFAPLTRFDVEAFGVGVVTFVVIFGDGGKIWKL